MSSHSKVELLIERTLFASRWLMAPFYLGLVLALLVLTYSFLVEVWGFCKIALGLAGPDKVFDYSTAILSVLTLIDLSLAANLVLMVIFAGYENFVSKLDTEGSPDRPDWMGKIDFSGMKLKLIASIVAISGIQLLKSFMEIHDSDPDELRWMAIIHVVFVGSGVLLALMDYITAKAEALHAK